MTADDASPSVIVIHLGIYLQRTINNKRRLCCQSPCEPSQLLTVLTAWPGMKPGFRSAVEMDNCTMIEGVSLEERRHRSEQSQLCLWCLALH